MNDSTVKTASGIPVHCACAGLVDVADLRPHPKNPNRHPDEQIALLAKNVRSLGWRHPVIVSRLSGCIVAGHGRVEAARLLQVAQVPVDYQAFADTAEEETYLIADNRLAELAEVDQPALDGILHDLEAQGVDVETAGFRLDEVATKIERGQMIEDNPKLAEWIEKRRASRERGRDVGEVNFWLCLVFQSYDQKQEFLKQFPDLETVYGMYVDGEALAAAVGKPVTANTQKPVSVPIDKTLAAMVAP